MFVFLLFTVLATMEWKQAAKFCLHCRHFSAPVKRGLADLTTPTCKAFPIKGPTEVVNMVTGQREMITEGYIPCRIARIDSHLCGVEGKMFNITDF